MPGGEERIVRFPRRLAVLVATGATVSALALGAAPAANASSSASGTKPLAAVLLADKNGFDHNPYDYDIVTAAVLAVLAAKPSSPVKVLTDGTVPLTAFLPNDRAFKLLVHQLTGQWVASEKALFAVVASLGIDTVEQVLLYHVVPGATITAADAVKANGAVLTTAQGGTLTVHVHQWKTGPSVRIFDTTPGNWDPRVVKYDINAGNLQIAHGINRVLLPGSSS
jgi:uncharacterized surface protein with fasciclin (FAS1) repeats